MRHLYAVWLLGLVCSFTLAFQVSVQGPTGPSYQASVNQTVQNGFNGGCYNAASSFSFGSTVQVIINGTAVSVIFHQITHIGQGEDYTLSVLDCIEDSNPFSVTIYGNSTGKLDSTGSTSIGLYTTCTGAHDTNSYVSDRLIFQWVNVDKVMPLNVLVNHEPVVFFLSTNCSACRNNCSWPHGQCENNACRCNKGFFASDCSIEFRTPDYACPFKAINISYNTTGWEKTA